MFNKDSNPATASSSLSSSKNGKDDNKGFGSIIAGNVASSSSMISSLSSSFAAGVTFLDQQDDGIDEEGNNGSPQNLGASAPGNGPSRRFSFTTMHDIEADKEPGPSCPCYDSDNEQSSEVNNGFGSVITYNAAASSSIASTLSVSSKSQFFSIEK